MIYPRIHMNGTSADELLTNYARALYALSDAIAAMQKTSPHGRDYYVISGEASSEAYRDHAARMLKLGQVYADLEKLCEHCQDAGGIVRERAL